MKVLCDECERAELVRLKRVTAWWRFWGVFSGCLLGYMVLLGDWVYARATRQDAGALVFSLLAMPPLVYMCVAFGKKSLMSSAFGKLTIALSRVINSVDGVVTYHAHVLEDSAILTGEPLIYLGFLRRSFAASSLSWRVYPWLHGQHLMNYQTLIGRSMIMSPEQLVQFHEVGRRLFVLENHLNVLSALDLLRRDCAVLAQIIEDTRASGPDGRLRTVKHLLREMSKGSFEPSVIRDHWLDKHVKKNQGNVAVD